MEIEKRIIMEVKKIISNFKKEEFSKSKKSQEEVVKLAEKLIEALKITEAPVPIVKILKELGFSVFAATMPKKDISGFIIIDEDLKEKFNTDKVIAIDKNDTLGRQRFTLAHEFAHYLFDFNENKSTTFLSTYDNTKSSESQESIPSRFAAEFLMPKKLFKEHYEKLSDRTRYEKIVQLVKDFDVTKTAIEKRFEELNLE